MKVHYLITYENGRNVEQLIELKRLALYHEVVLGEVAKPEVQGISIWKEPL